MKIAIIALINKVIEEVGVVITVLFMMLPDSPFVYVCELSAEWLSYINYVMPVTAIIAHLELYLTAVAIYYVIRIALRWVKAIE